MAKGTTVVSARMDIDTERRLRLLAALRGIPRQEVIIEGVLRLLETAPERPAIDWLLREVEGHD